jgi:hypothetical protein
VEGHEAPLHVRADAHLRGRTEQHTNLALAHLAEQACLLRVGLGIVDESDLLGR